MNSAQSIERRIRNDVVVNPEKPNITVFGYVTIEAIMAALPQLNNENWIDMVAKAVTEGNSYVKSIFTDGGVIDSKGRIHPLLPSSYSKKLRDELTGKGILTRTGAQFRDELGVDILAMNLRGGHYLHLLTPGFQQYLRYRPTMEFRDDRLIHEASKNPKAPMLPSIILMMGRRIDDLLEANPPAKGIIAADSIARSATFTLAQANVERSTATR